MTAREKRQIREKNRIFDMIAALAMTVWFAAIAYACTLLSWAAAQ